MPPGPLQHFRVVFAGIWLVYDGLDLTVHGTAAVNDLTTGPEHAPPGLVALQVGLIVLEVALLLGWQVWLAALGAAVLRGLEWYTYIELNDFAYFTVTALLLAQTRSSGPLFRPAPGDARVPAWPRRLLLLQAGWMYFATALLKLNPAWLSGGHLFVRHQYLAAAHHWPYPAVYRRCANSLGCNAALAWTAVACEFALAFALFFRPRRRVVVPIAVAVHGFGALSMNVWFFGASCVAQVALLSYPRTEIRRAT